TVVCDSRGIIHRGRTDLNGIKTELAELTNAAGRTGDIEAALTGADVLIGVSGGTIPQSAVAAMAPQPIVFALANPTPEVDPELAIRHCAVLATGRSDYPNQINNVLAFPGVFKGALAARATRITEGMKVAAADAIAGVVGDAFRPDLIVPSPFDERVAPAVAEAVAAAARADGVSGAGWRVSPTLLADEASETRYPKRCVVSGLRECGRERRPRHPPSHWGTPGCSGLSGCANVVVAAGERRTSREVV